MKQSMKAFAKAWYNDANAKEEAIEKIWKSIGIKAQT